MGGRDGKITQKLLPEAQGPTHQEYDTQQQKQRRPYLSKVRPSPQDVVRLSHGCCGAHEFTSAPPPPTTNTRMHALTHVLNEWMHGMKEGRSISSLGTLGFFCTLSHGITEQTSLLIMIIGLLYKKDYQGVRGAKALNVIQVANARTLGEMRAFVLVFGCWLFFIKSFQMQLNKIHHRFRKLRFLKQI